MNEKRPIKFLFGVLAPVLILIFAIGLLQFMPETVEDVQLKIFDAFQRLKPRNFEDVGVRIVDIDDESLKRLGQWPWPRTRVAELVSRLIESGAHVIVLDVVFSEPDRTSPAHIASLLPKDAAFESVRSRITELEDHDRVLANAIAKGKVVTGFSFTVEENESTPRVKAGFSYAGDDPAQYLPKFSGAVLTLPEIESAAEGNGSFNIIAERDGVVRRVPLIFRLEDNLYPSLVLEAVRVFQEAKNYIVKSAEGSGERGFGAHTGIANVKAGQFVIPTDGQGGMWLYGTRNHPGRWLSAWQVLSGEIGADSVSDSIVYIGTSAMGLKDMRTTPLNPVTAGVEVHAELTEQILLQNFLHRPDWIPGAELVYLIVLGLALILLLPRIGALWCAAVGGISIAVVFGFSWYAFSRFQWLVDPVLPSVTCAVIYLVASLTHFVRTESEKRRIRSAFGHYMAPVLVEKLAKDPTQLKLGGEIRKITVLFADIRNFTAISEKLNAEELTRFLNRYLTPMTDLIMREKGLIDKYIGDGIMAFWNAPLDDSEHARNACQAALNMRRYLVQLNQELKAEAEAQGRAHGPLHIGIGINTGECCVGNIGSVQLFAYSAVGDDVNLASRLEGQSKIFGADIIVGQNTYDRVPDYAMLCLDLIRVRGKENPVNIFTLLGDQSFKQDPGFRALAERHEKMLAAYRAREWTKALELVEECRRLDTPKTKLKAVYQLYMDRIRAFQANPPSADWEGVTVALTK